MDKFFSMLLSRALLILFFSIVAIACSKDKEERSCTYNGVAVNCDEMDRQSAPSQPSNSTQYAQCVTDTMEARISQADSERLCREGVTFANCVADANGSVSQEDAERLCRE
jgi:hypothetical protein